MRLIPTTGRGHQIRVHMMSTGHPIVADGAYGAKPTLALSDFKRPYKHRRGALETPLLTRTFLHASRLDVPAEEGVSEVCAQSGLPDDLQIALTKLRRFDSAEETCA